MRSQRLALASLALVLSGCGSVYIAWTEWIGQKDPELAELEDSHPELARQVKMGVHSMEKIPGPAFPESGKAGAERDDAGQTYLDVLELLANKGRNPGADYGNRMSRAPYLEPPEDGSGKASVTHRPLPEVLEIKLPGKVVESCLLMSGRHLLMVSKNPSSMFVFDPETKRISSLFNLADSCQYAAGGNRLVSYEAFGDKFVIYTLPEFKAERSHPSPFSEKILALGMGWGNPNLLWVFVLAGEQTHIYIGAIDRFDFKQVNSIDKSRLYSHQIPGRELLLGDMTGRRMALSGQLICLLGENEYELIQRPDRPILITANRLLVGYHGLRLFHGSMSIEQPLLLSPSGRLYMTFHSNLASVHWWDQPDRRVDYDLPWRVGNADCIHSYFFPEMNLLCLNRFEDLFLIRLGNNEQDPVDEFFSNNLIYQSSVNSIFSIELAPRRADYKYEILWGPKDMEIRPNGSIRWRTPKTPQFVEFSVVVRSAKQLVSTLHFGIHVRE